MNQSPWFDAIIEPSALLILALSVVSGLIAAWWLFPVGIVLWAFIFLRILLDPSLRLNQVISNRMGLTQRFQTPFNAIQKIQINIFNAISASPRGIRRTMLPLQAAVNRLIDQVYEQCNRMTPLENLRITAESEDSLRQKLETANSQAAAATDPVIKKDLEESAQSIQARLQQVVEMRQKLDRFDAQLNGLQNDLQSILTDVVRLQASDPRTLGAETARLVEKVKNEGEQLKF